MPNTTRGYRYPDGTGKIGQLDTHMQNLASDIDSKIGRVERGVGTVDITVVNSTATLNVVFATPFAAPPVVAVGPVGANAARLLVSINNVTATGFTLCARNTVDAGDGIVHWIAIG